METIIYVVVSIAVFYFGISMAFSLLGFFFDLAAGIFIGIMWLISRPFVLIAEYLSRRKDMGRFNHKTGSFSSSTIGRSQRRSTSSSQLVSFIKKIPYVDRLVDRRIHMSIPMSIDEDKCRSIGRSTARDEAYKNRPSNLTPKSKWTDIYKKKHKSGGTSTISIRTSLLPIWEKFTDLFREKE